MTHGKPATVKKTGNEPFGRDSGYRPARAGTDEIIALVRGWEDEEGDEQRETFEFLKHALDEHRLSVRKLFP